MFNSYFSGIYVIILLHCLIHISISESTSIPTKELRDTKIQDQIVDSSKYNAEQRTYRRLRTTMPPPRLPPPFDLMTMPGMGIYKPSIPSYQIPPGYPGSGTGSDTGTGTGSGTTTTTTTSTSTGTNSGTGTGTMGGKKK